MAPSFIMCAGDSIGWVERYTRVSDLDIHRRVVVEHEPSFGCYDLGGSQVEVYFFKFAS